MHNGPLYRLIENRVISLIFSIFWPCFCPLGYICVIVFSEIMHASLTVSLDLDCFCLLGYICVIVFLEIMRTRIFNYL